MLKSVLGWAAYLLMWQISTHSTEPTWPDPCHVETQRIEHQNSQALILSPVTNNVGNSVTCSERVSPLESLVRQRPICIAWTQSWSGDLGKSLLYQVSRSGPQHIIVGYFAYWTTERPWGDNSLTHWLLPAVAIDGFYSHLLFVLPGVQRLLYGPGDVEGVRVTYRLEAPNHLVPVRVVADDERHQEVTLDVSESVDDKGRIVVLNDVWSHQLGGKRAVSAARAGASQRCFGGDSLRTITRDVVAAFRLGSTQDPRRAGPAWGRE